MPLQTWLNKNKKNSQNIDKPNLTNKLIGSRKFELPKAI
jgi:hypothetical protein